MERNRPEGGQPADMWGQAVMDKREQPTGSLMADAADERRLVQAALSGEFSAFDALVERHWRKVASVVRHFLPDADEADDAVQETFVKAFQRLRDFRGEASVQTWLIRIAINLCKNRRQSFWKRKVTLFEGADEELLPGSLAAGEEVMLQGQQTGAIRAAVSRLPDKYRLPIILHYFEGLTGAEVAAVIGCKESAVWSRIYTGCRGLKKQLSDWVE
jgi:RNA polymerase sigma-70 factor, ECF subfamily